MDFDVSSLDTATGDLLEVEIVERKGLGHPDTICDGLSESLSLALSREYLARFGRILHHNVDKALLWGGAANPRFGGGEIVKPIEIYLAGRATARFEKGEIALAELAQQSAHAWFRRHLPTLDADRHVVIHSLIRPGSADLVELFERQRRSGVWLANDTSCGVGYAPLSRLETIVFRIERRLNSAIIQTRHPEIGPDIKVMGVRHGGRIRLTVACAFIGRHLSDIEAYMAAKARVADIARAIAQDCGAGDADVAVNTADDPATGSVYLTVTGTSAEAGDDGEAGRGNRVNGLITPFRPMTMESVAGKNPVTHVGKIYNVAAALIAQSIVENMPKIAEAHCLLVSRIGQPLDQPQIVELRLRPKRGHSVADFGSEAREIAQAEIARIGLLAGEMVEERIGIDRWPLRQMAPGPTADDNPLRQALLAEIQTEAAFTASETGRRVFSPRVMAALAAVPREAFVRPSEESYAYENTALPIGHGQTISQPYVVALMTDVLDLQPSDRVLEIGTGSGYQAAVLAHLAAQVFSIERIEALAATARARLQRLGLDNVTIRSGDGYRGWPEAAPFDAIIVTAAAPDVPPALIEQLKPGGRMVIPIDAARHGQTLTLLWRDAAGTLHRRPLLPVAFVPMLHST